MCVFVRACMCAGEGGAMCMRYTLLLRGFSERLCGKKSKKAKGRRSEESSDGIHIFFDGNKSLIYEKFMCLCRQLMFKKKRFRENFY